MERKHWIVGVVVVVAAAAAVAAAVWRPWLVELAGVTFTSSECGGMGKPEPTGVLIWVDGTTAEVRMREGLNCGDGIGSGRVLENVLSEGKLILQYEHLSCHAQGRSCAKCSCDRELLYRIEGLERRDYTVVLEQLPEDFD